MKKHTSLYLDMLRVLAAVMVFFSHLKRESFSGNHPLALGLGQYGQEGVAIFFVISGIVIAFVAREKERDFRSYLVARLGRLWSVMIPALLLTVVLDTAGRAIAPDIYTGPGIPAWTWSLTSVWHFLAPALFLNTVAFSTVDPGTNGPFWSLCCEFWYYMFFGLAFFLRGPWRIVTLVAAVAIAGPFVVSLFPIWAFGLIVYYYLGRSATFRPGLLAWAASWVLLLALMLFKYKLAVLGAAAFPGFGLDVTNTATWISHFAVGAACAINIVIFDRLGGLAVFHRQPVQNTIRFFAARSFSLYLYQAPCLFFYAALTRGMAAPGLRLLVIAVLSLLTILVLAEFTENRKKWYARMVDRLLPRALPGWKAARAR